MSKVICLAAITAALVACSSTEPSAPPASGIHVIKRPRNDTVQAILPIPLIIQVRGTDGKPLAHTSVAFNGTIGMLVTLAPAGTSNPVIFDGTFFGTTDDSGQVAAQIRLGPKPPLGQLVISVGSLSNPVAEDTLEFGIEPGAAASVRMLRKDTTVYVDHKLQLRGGTVDRLGNLRSDPVEYQAGPSLAVSPQGVVTPSLYARSWVVVRGALGQDTGYVSVVPHGRVLAAVGGTLLLFDLDGSRSAQIPSLVVNASPAWAPDGKHFAYSTYGLSPPASGGQVFVGDTTGAVSSLLPAGMFINATDPRYSRDGAWIYFAGQFQQPVFNLWRLHPDGTGLEQLGSNLGGAGVDWFPDPSPDGTHLVFTTLGSNVGTGWGVRTVDLASLQVSSWILPGLTARWSPDGQRLAVFPDATGPILIANADGSVNKYVNTGSMYFRSSGEWSPDGQWLVLSDGNQVTLAQVDTGLLLPIAWASSLGQPAWHP